jgi:hypothetical protein
MHIKTMEITTSSVECFIQNVAARKSTETIATHSRLFHVGIVLMLNIDFLDGVE